MKALLLVFLCVCPARIVCPIDGIVVGATGKTRVVKGHTECQYQHVWIHYRESLLVDEPHILWAPCEVK